MGLALSIMSNPLVDHCLELLAPLGTVRARRMFGGHGLYVDDLFIALIAFERLYLKVDAQTQSAFAEAGCEIFSYVKPPRPPLRGDRSPEGERGNSGRPVVASGNGKPITMSYWTVPAEAMESPALMQPWARQAMAAALRARAVKALAAPRKTRAAVPKATPAASRARR
jgi:DNA transformation protein and related proteins